LRLSAKDPDAELFDAVDDGDRHNGDASDHEVGNEFFHGVRCFLAVAPFLIFPRALHGSFAMDFYRFGPRTCAPGATRVIRPCMPTLTLRMTDAEMTAADDAAGRQKTSRSDFARRAIVSAAKPEKPSSVFGAWKGRVSYRKAMKQLRG
jgi:hypothetical protein